MLNCSEPLDGTELNIAFIEIVIRRDVRRLPLYALESFQSLKRDKKLWRELPCNFTSTNLYVRDRGATLRLGWGGGEHRSTLGGRGGATRHLFLQLFIVLNILGGGGHVPPGPPCSAVLVRTSYQRESVAFPYLFCLWAVSRDMSDHLQVKGKTYEVHPLTVLSFSVDSHNCSFKVLVVLNDPH